MVACASSGLWSQPCPTRKSNTAPAGLPRLRCFLGVLPFSVFLTVVRGYWSGEDAVA